jgi:hypothetical protein
VHKFSIKTGTLEMVPSAYSKEPRKMAIKPSDIIDIPSAYEIIKRFGKNLINKEFIINYCPC